MQRIKALRKQLYRRLILVAALVIGCLTLGAAPSDAARIVVRVGAPPRVHRPVVVRHVVVKPVKPAPRRVWKAGHWEYRPALHKSVWVPGRWVYLK